MLAGSIKASISPSLWAPNTGIEVHFDQREFDLKCEWGLDGLLALQPFSDAIVIVDILSFQRLLISRIKYGICLTQAQADWLDPPSTEGAKHGADARLGIRHLGAQLVRTQ
jgi:hypothetical protein